MGELNKWGSSATGQGAVFNNLAGGIFDVKNNQGYQSFSLIGDEVGPVFNNLDGATFRIGAGIRPRTTMFTRTRSWMGPIASIGGNVLRGRTMSGRLRYASAPLEAPGAPSAPGRSLPLLTP